MLTITDLTNASPLKMLAHSWLLALPVNIKQKDPKTFNINDSVSSTGIHYWLISLFFRWEGGWIR